MLGPEAAAALGATGLLVGIALFRQFWRARRASERAASSFLARVEQLLRQRGEHVAIHPVAGNRVTHIAKRNEERVGLRILRAGQRVRPGMVRWVVHDAARLGCRQAVILTDREFSPQTFQAALEDHNSLVDQVTLKRWRAKLPATVMIEHDRD
ncbi:MAG TPA: hypothetical protein VF171_01210 [Trueperaceae bacterium]